MTEEIKAEISTDCSYYQDVVKNKIYIDGVNVAECKQLIEDYQQCNRIEGKYEHIFNVCEFGERGVEDYFMSCRDNPNCCYKQLQRLKQENEKLKTKIQEVVRANDVIIAESSAFLKNFCDEPTLLTETAKQRDNYRKALEEIREIAGRLWSNKYQSVEEAENDVYFISNKINEVLE